MEVINGTLSYPSIVALPLTLLVDHPSFANSKQQLEVKLMISSRPLPLYRKQNIFHVIACKAIIAHSTQMHRAKFGPDTYGQLSLIFHI